MQAFLVSLPLFVLDGLILGGLGYSSTYRTTMLTETSLIALFYVLVDYVLVASILSGDPIKRPWLGNLAERFAKRSSKKN